NDKEQDSRRTPTTARQRSQRRTARTTNPNSPQERHLGPTRTNNIGHYETSTAEPRHDLGRTQHRQVLAGKRHPGSLNHAGPDKRVSIKRWSDPGTSTGASATNNTSNLMPAESCGTSNIAKS